MGQASNCFNEGCPGLKRKFPGVTFPDLIKKGEVRGQAFQAINYTQWGVWTHVV